LDRYAGPQVEPVPELLNSCRRVSDDIIAQRRFSAARLIVLARAPSEELRDIELIVSLDHCSRWWEAPTR